MSSTDHLGTYAEGWTKGDAGLILQAASDSFVFDDPNAGRINKTDFTSYFSKLKQLVDSTRGPEFNGSFMELSEIVTNEDGDLLTAWCWWEIPGTDLQGSGLIKGDAEGILSERITYYTQLSS
jgi:hypothetical protein